MQRDLFEVHPGFVSADKESKMATLERYRFSFRLDQLILVSILAIIAFVFIFSFGVEKGKQYSVSALKAEHEKREQIVMELSAQIRRLMANQPELQNQARQPVAAIQAPAAAPSSESSGSSLETLPAQESSEGSVQPSVETPAIAAQPQGKYTIQLVTYTSQADVDRQMKKLVDKGLAGFVIPSGDYLQLCVNAFENRSEAKKLLAKLQAEGLAPRDAYIRPIAR